MKNIVLIVAALLFSTLFHKQGIGLNLSIFSILSLLVLFFYNQPAFKQKSTIAFSTIYLLTAIAIFMYNNSLSIVANTVALFTLVGHVSHQKTSIYVNWFNGIFSITAGIFYRNFNSNKEKEVVTKKNIDYVHGIKIIGIPLLLIAVFINLYRHGNPVFNKLINGIDFSIINYQWILVAFCGYYLFYNISQPVVANPVTQKDTKTGNILINKGGAKPETLKKEYQFGFILISALNILILFFLITDVTYLITSTDLTASSFSNQVHHGIYALIASIVIAIGIILYFFKGQLNFYVANKQLKQVAYIWITLNAILVVNIVIKDIQYIYYFGLTYKRIGVLAYVLLTIIGLTTTFIKVKNLKNFWYLFRINTLTAFTILTVSCTINWDSCITIYNLNYSKSMDFKYLIKLSNNNTFILKNYLNKNHLDHSKTIAINKKYKAYVKELKAKKWQEIQFDNLKIK